jgi:hypothetical protein
VGGLKRGYYGSSKDNKCEQNNLIADTLVGMVDSAHSNPDLYASLNHFQKYEEDTSTQQCKRVTITGGESVG